MTTETANTTNVAELRAERAKLKERLAQIKTELKGLRSPRKPRGERKRKIREGSLTADVVAFLRTQKADSETIIKHFCSDGKRKDTSVRTLISNLCAAGAIQHEGARGSYVYYATAEAAPQA